MKKCGSVTLDRWRIREAKVIKKRNMAASMEYIQG